MNGIGSGLQYASQALNAFSWGMATTAHNLANINTSDFKPQQAVYATGPDGWGVELDAIIPKAQVTNAQPRPVAGDAFQIGVASTQGVAHMPSETDVAREMTEMIATEYGYKANAVLVRTGDAMQGSLLDMKA